MTAARKTNQMQLNLLKLCRENSSLLLLGHN